ncbi:MAG: hypothetical protein ACJ8MO_08775, partial [Bacillus sp. (in: firmicutes)]
SEQSTRTLPRYKGFPIHNDESTVFLSNGQYMTVIVVSKPFFKSIRFKGEEDYFYTKELFY